MNIQSLGLSCFKITTKDTTVLVDPYDKSTGLTPPRGNVDIVVTSDKNNPQVSFTQSLSGEFFLVNDPGEYDIKGVTIAGIPLKQEKGWAAAFLIEGEDIKILSLGNIKDFNIKDEDLESLGDIDILILPVGGKSVLDADEAAKVVARVEPHIVIPSCYKSDGLSLDLDSKETFIKEMGGKFEEMDKLSIKKKDFNFEETKLYILNN